MKKKKNITIEGQKSQQKGWFSAGFTLIELLVVISVIGILASLVLTSFMSAQKQARDAQRKSDLRQFQTALEVYANANNGLFPANTSCTNTDALCVYLTLSTCSQDPVYDPDLGSPIYRYQTADGTVDGDPEATEYTLWAELERSSDYWIVCSTGQSAEGVAPASGNCPL